MSDVLTNPESESPPEPTAQAPVAPPASPPEEAVAAPPPSPAPEMAAPEAETPASAPSAAALPSEDGDSPEEVATAEEEDLEEEPQEEDGPEDAGEAPAVAETPPPSNKHWYVVKVQSGREESIKEAIERRVKIEDLGEFFGEIIIPIERYTEVRNGKRMNRTRKLYPGYLMVNLEYNDRMLYLFRETSGVGDFVGGGVNRPPPPMPPKEVEKMLATQGKQEEGKPGTVIHAKPTFGPGDRVRVKEGTFAQMEGEVREVIEARHLVRVELTIFGRPVPVELEYWQVEPV